MNGIGTKPQPNKQSSPHALDPVALMSAITATNIHEIQEQRKTIRRYALNLPRHNKTVSTEDNVVVSHPDEFFKKQANLDLMSSILRTYEHPIYFHITLPIAWLAGEVISRYLPTYGGGGNMLEIGTGDGLTTSVTFNALTENGANIKEFVCVDPFETALTTTQAKIEKEFPEKQHIFRYWKSGLENPELRSKFVIPQKGFDGITALFSINYATSLNELSEGLSNISGMLAEHGVAILLGNFYDPHDWEEGNVIDQRLFGVMFEMQDFKKNGDPHRITVQLNSAHDWDLTSNKFSNYIVPTGTFVNTAKKYGLHTEIINPKNLFSGLGEITELSPICRIVVLRK